MLGNQLKEHVVVVFLGGLIAAFVAGITAYVYVNSRITAEIQSVFEKKAPVLVQEEVDKIVVPEGKPGLPG